MSNETDLTFEQALAELEDHIDRLEAGDLTLEESLSLYERGQWLAQFCQQLLDQAALRVAQFTASGVEEELTIV